MNYDIYNKKLMALDQGLETWWHLLLGNHTIIHMDHTNLTFYHQPQKLSLQAKQAVARIMQYDISIKHKARLLNKADALSWQPDYPQGISEEEITFPPFLFINELTTTDIHLMVELAQERHRTNLLKIPNLMFSNNCYYYNSWLVVPEDNKLRQGVLSLYHDSTTAGHPGIRWTLHTIVKDY